MERYYIVNEKTSSNVYYSKPVFIIYYLCYIFFISKITRHKRISKKIQNYIRLKIFYFDMKKKLYLCIIQLV